MAPSSSEDAEAPPSAPEVSTHDAVTLEELAHAANPLRQLVAQSTEQETTDTQPTGVELGQLHLGDAVRLSGEAGIGAGG